MKLFLNFSLNITVNLVIYVIWLFKKNGLISLNKCKHDYCSSDVGFISQRYAALQEKIAMESDIPSGQQLVLFQNRELEEIVNDLTCEVQNYPTSVLHGQLFLYNKERIDIKKIMIPDIRMFFFIDRSI